MGQIEWLPALRPGHVSGQVQAVTNGAALRTARGPHLGEGWLLSAASCAGLSCFSFSRISRKYGCRSACFADSLHAPAWRVRQPHGTPRWRADEAPNTKQKETKMHPSSHEHCRKAGAQAKGQLDQY